MGREITLEKDQLRRRPGREAKPFPSGPALPEGPAVGGVAFRLGGFSTTRRYVHQIGLPPTGSSRVLNYRVQYRYRSVPFGQKSNWVTFTSRS